MWSVSRTPEPRNDPMPQAVVRSAPIFGAYFLGKWVQRRDFAREEQQR